MALESKCKIYMLKLIIVIGCFFVQMLSVGISGSFGILYKELRGEFGTEHSESAWIASIFNGCIGFVGVPLGIITNRVGERWATVAGTMLLSTGLLSSMFATQMSTIYVTYGLVAGTGAGVIHYCGNTILGPHFNDSWRPLAMAFASAGSSVSALILPHLMTWVIDNYDWRKTFLCLSCVCLIGVPSGLVFFPPEKQTTQPNEVNLSDRKTLKHSFQRLSKNCDFLIFFISSFLLSFILFGPATFLPDLMHEFNKTPSQIATSVMCLGVGGLIGRICFGITGHKMSRHLTFVLALSTLMFGICSGLTILVRSSAMFIIMSLLTGIGFGGRNGLHIATIAKLVHPDDLRIGVGIVYFSEGIGFVSGMPLAGLVTDLLHTERGSFAFCGFMSIISALMLLIISARKRRICRGRRKYQIKKRDHDPETKNKEQNEDRVLGKQIRMDGIIIM